VRPRARSSSTAASARRSTRPPPRWSMPILSGSTGAKAALPERSAYVIDSGSPVSVRAACDGRETG